MLDWIWISSTGTTLLMVLLSGLGLYLVLMVLTRLSGLRSFSKMSSFDFALTVAIGSVLAATLLDATPALLTGAFGLAVIYGIQYLVSTARRRFPHAMRWVDNEPLLLMARGEVLSAHLDTARMTESDLQGKLRAAGITHRSQVLAVVFETTGDVSVLKTSDTVEPWLFEGVRGAEHLWKEQGVS